MTMLYTKLQDWMSLKQYEVRIEVTDTEIFITFPNQPGDDGADRQIVVDINDKQVEIEAYEDYGGNVSTGKIKFFEVQEEHIILPQNILTDDDKDAGDGTPYCPTCDIYGSPCWCGKNEDEEPVPYSPDDPEYHAEEDEPVEIIPLDDDLSIDDNDVCPNCGGVAIGNKDGRCFCGHSTVATGFIDYRAKYIDMVKNEYRDMYKVVYLDEVGYGDKNTLEYLAGILREEGIVPEEVLDGLLDKEVENA